MASICRKWSNKMLKEYAHLFKGNVINISGFRDDDKDGGKYKDYFKNANKYAISNCGDGYRGQIGNGEIEINLEKDLQLYSGYFDVVFNHTTLEHVYDFQKAFKNLCSITNDILILVVPYLQKLHNANDKSYFDYWRFTEESLKEMCKRNNMYVLTVKVKKPEYKDVDLESYIFLIATKQKDKWKNYNWS